MQDLPRSTAWISFKILTTLTTVTGVAAAILWASTTSQSANVQLFMTTSGKDFRFLLCALVDVSLFSSFGANVPDTDAASSTRLPPPLLHDVCVGVKYSTTPQCLPKEGPIVLASSYIALPLLLPFFIILHATPPTAAFRICRSA
ncbi:hypothetical protein V492_06177 [Pseudogymnoascus sp. VKM F-4246]|nr:hypothetical protein V492_06177 [Pseudogymnoascus sp. VKM F-4246]